MPVPEYKLTRIHRNDIRYPQNPWKSCRRVDLRDEGLQNVADAELRRWLEQFGQYVELIQAGTFFSSMNRISLFWSSWVRTPYLKTLRVTGPAVSARNSLPEGAASLGDVLLQALNQAPALEELAITKFSFASPETVESFFASSKTLTHLELDHIKALGAERKDMEAVGRAFRRGIARNQTSTIIVRFGRGDNQEKLLRDILLGIMKNKNIQDLRLEVRGAISDHTVTALQFLFAGLTSVRNLRVEGSVALVALFRGIASCAVSIDKIEVVIDEVSLLKEHSMDVLLAEAIREWSEGSTAHGAVSTLAMSTSPGIAYGLGAEAGHALADGIARMMMMEHRPLERLDIGCNVIPEPSHFVVFRQMHLLQEVRLKKLPPFLDWTALNSSTQRLHGCKLTEFELRDWEFSSHELRHLPQYLSRISSLEKLIFIECDITAEGAVLLRDLIEQNRLKELCLIYVPVETQDAIMILGAVHASKSMEKLHLDAHTPYEQFDINDCHEALADVLLHSHLISLHLSSSVGMQRETVEVLANGLRQNTHIKELTVPHIKAEDLFLLGGPLGENHALEHLELGRDENLEFEDNFGTPNFGTPIFAEATAAEEQSMCKFIDMLPQMKGLKKMYCLFDRKPSMRLVDRTILAMRTNMVLEEAAFTSGSGNAANYLFSNQSVEYFLELNRLHRRQYLASIGDETLPSSLLPLILAKMTRPAFSSHLYYFLRHGAGLLQSDAHPSSLKR